MADDAKKPPAFVLLDECGGTPLSAFVVALVMKAGSRILWPRTIYRN